MRRAAALALLLSACHSPVQERLSRARELTAASDPKAAAEAWRGVMALLEQEKGQEAQRVRTEALATMGDLAYLKLGDPRGAAATYRTLLAQDPWSEAAWSAREKLADISRQELKDLPEAIAQWEALAGSGRPNADRFAYEAARGYFTLNEFEQSRKGCKALFQRWPEGEWADDALYLIGSSFQFENRHAEAVEAFSDVTRHWPTGEMAARSRLQIGKELSAMGRHEEALQSMLAALAGHPDPHDVQEEIKRERAALVKVKETEAEDYGEWRHE